MVFILMLLAAAGMVFGAVKMKQGAEWGKGVTVACAVVALLLAGVHLKSRMGAGRPSRKEITKMQEREASYRQISAEKLAADLAKEFPGQKAAVIRTIDMGFGAPDMEDKIEGLRKGFGEDIEIIEIISPEIPPEVKEQMEHTREMYKQESGGSELPPEYMMEFGPMMEMLDSAQFNKLTRRVPDEADIVVLLVDFPYDLERMSLLGLKKTVAGIVNMAQPKMKAAIKQGFIHSVVMVSPEADFRSMDVPKELDEAFARRYLLIDSENIDEIAAKYPSLFPED
jgi:hypothetical protein